MHLDRQQIYMVDGTIPVFFPKKSGRLSFFKSYFKNKKPKNLRIKNSKENDYVGR